MDSAALYRLMTWLSPSYPVGAFSYSHGLEQVVDEGKVHDSKTLIEYLCSILMLGTGRSDAILFAHAHRATTREDFELLIRIAELGAAFAATKERRLEATAQGQAFSEVTRKTWQSQTLAALSARPSPVVIYPIAVAVAAADHGIALRPALEAYVHAFAANLVSAGMRLISLGHTDGQRALMSAELAVTDAVAQGLTGDLNKVGGITVMAELAAMKHETQYSRIFRS